MKSDELLIEAIKQNDAEKVKALIESGAGVNIHGSQQEWTPLNYAAGKGTLALVKLLVEAGGADVTLTGRDNRTPYSIAVAAGHRAVARYLEDVEELAGNDQGNTSSQARRKLPYCKAFHVRDLREFPGWIENGANLGQVRDAGDDHGQNGEETKLSDDDVLFIHQDFTVTQSMFHNEHVIMSEISSEWQAFCHEVLNFMVPDDFDLMPAERSADVGEDDGHFHNLYSQAS